MNHQQSQNLILRRNRLRQRCAEKKMDGFITFDFSDVFYLIGFPSEGCTVFTAKSGDYVFAPPLLAEHVKTFIGNVEGLTILSEKGFLSSFDTIAKKHHLQRIGYDPQKVTVALYKDLLGIKNVKWVSMNGFVLDQRSVKQPEEIELIAQACHITCESANVCFEQLEEGQTEEEVAYQLEQNFRQRGSSKVAFETIVAFNENAAYPHHVVSSKKLTPNSVVLMDLGCTVGGYRSDLTRTFFFGKITPQFQKIYDIVKQAQQEGIAAVKEGVTAGNIDRICREVIGKAGYARYFVHGTGHGVGIDIHELPHVSSKSDEILKENMVITVEPGIYLPGEFGVRIEDSLRVTKTGCKILTV
jgi:Xaa-Pro aminopeptidase/Xaa-Pro dipeptidase